MIVLGAILLILGFVSGIQILWTIGVILLVIGAVFWILGSHRTRRSAAGKSGTDRRRHGGRPADDSAAIVIARSIARERERLAGRLGRPAFMLCGVELSRPNAACAISRASASSSPGSSSRSTPTQISTY